VLSQLKQGDHVVVSNQLYGRSLKLLVGELGRLGIGSTVVDPGDLAATEAAFRAASKMLVVETIANPLLRVADLAALAKIAREHDAVLLVDNTFASPVICRPLEWGANLVLESLTKIINGHSDVLLGMLCGPERLWQRVPAVLATWGLTAAPFECWLAARGLGTLHLRVERAASNALAAAKLLDDHRAVAKVHYPGLPDHRDHALAVRQFERLFGSMVTFDLGGGRTAAEAFIAAARRIPFCPSLGDLCTTLTHPETTSHRGLTADERASLGISGGTIRLSVGIESSQFVLDALAEGLSAAS
jgi:cystathionine beta-lyase/cystathionine gamma-synthase